MTKAAFLPFLNLFKRLGIALLIFTLLRWVFYLFNQSYFTELNFSILWGGLRFDISAIAYWYIPFIVFSLLPFAFNQSRYYQVFLKVLFYLSSLVCLLLAIIDIVYFRFTFKRTTADIFDFISATDETFNLIPQFLMDYWYLIIVLAVFIIGFEFLYRKTEKKLIEYHFSIQGIVFFILGLGIAVTASRGGLQLRPISPLQASQYSSVQNVPLVLNTPFTIIRTLFKEQLKKEDYFTANQLDKIYTPVHLIQNSNQKPKNVVLIILESFSKEYIGAYNNGNGYTPFLDSLMQHSIVFENAFANGKKSIEALPSILAGIPNLMENPYITSAYNNNNIKGLGSLLKEINYNTSFYHGGTNGTMSFDAFVQMAGINTYFGRAEYNNEKDYDGKWGIFDEPYFQYFANELSQKQQPFFSSIFSLSSHHPYTIPEQHQNQFPKGELEIDESIGYTDFALKKFFKTASKMDWFENTVFIITADHTAQSNQKAYANRMGIFRIPLIIFQQQTPAKKSTIITQQSDIVPLILSYTPYSGHVIYFGNNPLDSNNNHFAVNYLNGIYQLIEGDYSYQFDGKETIGLYNFRTDPELKTDLKSTEVDQLNYLDKKLKAIIQQYNNRIIENKLNLTK